MPLVRHLDAGEPYPYSSPSESISGLHGFCLQVSLWLVIHNNSLEKDYQGSFSAFLFDPVDLVKLDVGNKQWLARVAVCVAPFSQLENKPCTVSDVCC